MEDHTSLSSVPRLALSLIRGQLRPSWSRSRTTHPAETRAEGARWDRPDFVPRSRAYSSPAMTLSLITDRSSSAIAAMIVNIAFPIGVLVSRAC